MVLLVFVSFSIVSFYFLTPFFVSSPPCSSSTSLGSPWWLTNETATPHWLLSFLFFNIIIFIIYHLVIQLGSYSKILCQGLNIHILWFWYYCYFSHKSPVMCLEA